MRVAACSSTRAGSHAALSSCMLSLGKLSPAHMAGASNRSAPACAPNAAATARSLQSSCSSLPFSMAPLLQSSKRHSQPPFPPPASTAFLMSTGSACEAAIGGDEAADAASGLVGEGEDDEETLRKKPRKGARPKKPPDLGHGQPQTLHEGTTVPGSSPDEGEQILCLSR